MLSVALRRLGLTGALLLTACSTSPGSSAPDGGSGPSDAAADWRYVQWLDPGTIVADAGLVTAWLDKSGMGNDVSAYFSPPFPAVDPAAANGHNSVLFQLADSGTASEALVTADVNDLDAQVPGFDIGTDDFAILVVARLTRYSPYYVWAAGFIASCCFPATVSIVPADGGLAAESYAGNSVATSVGFGDGAYHVLVARRTSGTLELRVDGTSKGTTPDTDSVSAGVLTLGGWPGDYAEVRVLRGPIGAGELAAIEGALKAKYGVP